MDRTIDDSYSISSCGGTREGAAKQAARVIRELGPYRWVGLYDVRSTEISVFAWDGPDAPIHPKFPITSGLNGAAVESKTPVIAQDVAADARHLATSDGTRSAMIVPIIAASGAVVGTIDVEASLVDAFTRRDEELLTECAKRLIWLWRVS